MKSPLHVLIVEDSENDAAMVARLLDKAGYDVREVRVETADEMRDALERQEWDVVICDYQMPQFSAPAALALVKRSGRDIPFIVVSGAMGEDVAVAMMKAGAHDYLIKDKLARLVPAVERELRDALTRRERKRDESALRESEERYRKLLELAPVGIAVHSDGKIVFTNPAGARLLGADSEAQLIGKPIAEIIHPEQMPAVKSRIRRMMAGEQGLYPAEEVFIKLDGTPIQVDVIATPLSYQGKPAVQVIVHDITGRKLAEAERAQLLAQVQVQARQIAQIVNTVPEGVLLLDGDGLVMMANPAGQRDLETLAGIAVGEQLTHLGELRLAQLLGQTDHGAPWQEVRAGRRIYEAIARPIADREPSPPDSTPKHWVVVINDVTQARAVRDQLMQQERLAAVGELAAGIAHDFNNILAIISLHASLIIRTAELTDRDRERLTIISEQTNHASRLIQQVLDFSRRAVLERRPLDLGLLLHEQVDLLTRTLPEKIQVTLSCEPGDYLVLADATRLQQMLMNLAVNARDAMPEGGSLLFELSRQANGPGSSPPGGPWLRLNVTDDGTGIAPEAVMRLFEPFFTTKPRGQGTGLGLAQVYGIVKQHEGEITVQSTPGQGTSFTVYLPAVTTPDLVVEAQEVGTETGGGESILLVEDNKVLLEAMGDLIGFLGYQVVPAGNGAEALAVLEQRGDAIDLVLTDLIMPGMGGEALLAAIQARGLSVPVVILSGHPLEGELDELKSRGLAGWLLKPPKRDELANLIAHAIAGRRQRW